MIDIFLKLRTHKIINIDKINYWVNFSSAIYYGNKIYLPTPLVQLFSHQKVIKRNKIINNFLMKTSAEEEDCYMNQNFLSKFLY